MAQNSKIEWTDATWNPIRARLRESIEVARPDGTLQVIQPWGYHCERISDGCVNCYAETMNKRMLPAWGTGLKYTVPNRERVEIFLDKEELLKPLRWRKPRKVFPCSMTDWCAEFVTDEMRDRMLAVAALCPQHTFQFLTKRADRCAEYFAASNFGGERVDVKAEVQMMCERPARFFPRAFDRLPLNSDKRIPWPLANVLIGFSAENQECFDTRWEHMRKLAAVGWRVWCSAEPLLSAINMKYALRPNPYDRIPGGYRGDRPDMMAKLSWVVVGGESGHGARPMHPDWARSLRDQCVAASVPFFFKQWGQWGHREGIGPMPYASKDVRDLVKIGILNRLPVKSITGRLLDGREWNELPCNRISEVVQR